LNGPIKHVQHERARFLWHSNPDENAAYAAGK
jgi:hypothetical protein